MLRTPVAALAVSAALLLTACGAEEPPAAQESTSAPSTPTPSESSSPAATPTPEEETGTVIEVTVEGDTITPEGERIAVPVGEPFTLTITSDRDGEMHIHSAPEVTVDFGPGETTQEITIDVPGLVEMEEHDADVLVATLEVR